MGVSPSGGSDVRGGTIGVGDLRLPPPEHSRTVHCEQAQYGPVSGGRVASGVKGGQVVVRTGWIGLRWESDGSLGGRTD